MIPPRTVMVRGVKLRQMLGCAVVLGLVLAVVGVVCVEYHLVVLRDVWRDATMVRPGASQLQPVPAGGHSANPTEFEKPLDGTQMSVPQVRRVVDTIRAAGQVRLRSALPPPALRSAPQAPPPPRCS